jgi:hypothetical protein
MTAVYSGARTRTLALVIFLHLALALILMGQRVLRDRGSSTGRIDIVFIAPVTKPAQPVPLPSVPEQIIAKPEHRVADKPREAPAPAVAMAEAPSPEPVENKTEPTFIDTAALIGMAGKIDKEVRPPGENLLSGAEGPSLRKKMDEAFAAAHLAVPLKWYEAARIELFSAPNDPKKIYQVKTAFGTYCLFYADRLKDPTAPSQPAIGNCPRRF